MPLGSYLRTRGVKDGVLGGQRSWLVLGILMWVARFVKRLASRPSELVAVERLEPGQSITVSALEPEESPRRRRRRT